MSKKLTYEYVKKAFSDRGFILLSKKYNNSYSKLKYKCNNGHNTEIDWTHFNSGGGCKVCSKKRRIEKRRHSYSFVKNKFRERGYKLLSSLYINCESKLEYKCPNNHIGKITFSNFNKGKGCNICATKIVSDNQKTSYRDIKKIFERRNYKLISKYEEYKNSHSKLNYICPNGHTGSIVFNNFKYGSGCIKCNGSRGENSIKKFLKENSIGFEIEKIFKDCRNILPLRFDFFVKKYNILIEYQGEQHYKKATGYFKKNSSLKENKKRDQIKRDFAKKNNIKLLEIPYWEFTNINKILKEELQLCY